MYSLLLIGLSWMIFAITDMGELGRYLLSMIGVPNGTGASFRQLLTSYGAIMLIGAVGIIPAVGNLRNVIYNKSRILTFVLEIALFVLCIAAIVRDSYNPFLYFRF